MAKKTKNPATETPTDGAPAGDTGTAPAESAAAAREKKALKDRFARVFVDGAAVPPIKEDGTARRIAPQLKVIADTLEVVGPEGCTREELIAKLTGVLVTRQPVGRILSYYQKDLVNFGLATRTPAAE